MDHIQKPLHIWGWGLEEESSLHPPHHPSPQVSPLLGREL